MSLPDLQARQLHLAGSRPTLRVFIQAHSVNSVGVTYFIRQVAICVWLCFFPDQALRDMKSQEVIITE